jgi:dipeptidyl aminopeptidase/acylaminoacyl peptidase
MFKNSIITILLVICFNCKAFCQKRPIDYEATKDWPVLNAGGLSISNDGKFAMYSISSEKNGQELTVQSTDGYWKKEFNNATDACFSGKSDCFFFRLKDTLGILKLGSDSIRYINHVESYKNSAFKNNEWLSYIINNAGNKQLIVSDLINGYKKKYDNPNDYEFTPDGQSLIITVDSNNNMANRNTLIAYNLIDGNETTIFKGYAVNNVLCDDRGRQIVFTGRSPNDSSNNISIFCYALSEGKANLIVWDNTPGMDGLYLNQNFINPEFSPDGSKLFFSVKLKKQNPVNPLPNHANVDIWNYKDDLVQSFQIHQKNESHPYLTSRCVINLKKKSEVFCLERDENEMTGYNISPDSNSKFALVKLYAGDISEDYWQRPIKDSVYLMSTDDGTEILLNKNISFIKLDSYEFSPDGKYVLWFDDTKSNWFSYNINRQITVDITQKITTPLYDVEDDHPYSKHTYYRNLCANIPDENAILIQDEYDIWKVDLDGKKSPVNLTNGFGRQHKIKFSILNFNNSGLVPGFSPNQSVLLSAFNTTNKYNGFFRLYLGKAGKLTKISMGPYAYYLDAATAGYRSIQEFQPPLKAKNSGVYLVTRMSVKDYPNIFVTKNFNAFTQLSVFAPQKEYNWIDDKLLHWKMMDGKEGEGILYKPEDFNPKKKYPVIFYYYEKLSDNLNRFLYPALSDAPLNIPWFVSNGYLVFVPNIYYKIGHTGNSVYNSIVSAAKYISKKPWAGKLGLQGHSFGGFETNYLVTRTNLFTAAAAASGPTDLISFAFSLWPGSGIPMGSMVENQQDRMGSTLWQSRRLYIENSPIFYAVKVKTPLLIMHNKNDGNVPFEQGLEWYLALRRLQKKVWLLQYDGEAHNLFQEKNQIDYTTRLMQFFGYYLKGEPAPKWMTDGVPASMKGIDDGLELSTNGTNP